MFPDMLAQFIDKPRSISISPPRSDSHPTATTTVPPSLHSIRSLRALLSARAASYAEEQLTTIYEHTVYEAQCLRNTADEEFASAFEEQKLDLQARKEDALEELQADIEKIVDEKVQELDVLVTEYMEEVGEKLESEISGRLNKIVDEKLLKGVSRCTAKATKWTKRCGETRRAGHTAGDRKRYRISGCMR